MHALLLPLKPRFIVYTSVLLVTALLLFEVLHGFTSPFIEIPLVVFIALAVIGTVDVLQTRHAILDPPALQVPRPPVFIDAVGVGNLYYENRAKIAHETFPELRDYIADNYHLVQDVGGTRVYVRNDRL